MRFKILARITPQEQMVLDALLPGKRVSMVALVEILYPNADCEPDFAHTRVTMAIGTLRKRLKAVGYAIKTEPRKGYTLIRAG